MEPANQYKPDISWRHQQSGHDPEEREAQSPFYSFRRSQQDDHLNICLKDGAEYAITDGHIQEWAYEPGNGIFLFHQSGSIKIEGRNLKELYRLLRYRKLSEIRDFCDNPAMLFETDALFVSKIIYDSHNMIAVQ